MRQDLEARLNRALKKADKTPAPINEARFALFRTAYLEGLRDAVLADKTGEYAYSVEAVPGVVDKMMRALRNGSYNHAGRGFQNTCKRLGIKHTRKAIEDYVRETP